MAHANVAVYLTLMVLFETTYGIRLLPDSSIFNQDVSQLQPADNSDAVINFLMNVYKNGGNFAPGGLQFDESMYLLNASSPGSTIQEVPILTANEYSPDCTTLKKFPLVNPGGIEGTNPPTYSKCSGDCHIAVVDSANKAFYDSFGSVVKNNELHCACAIQWCSNYNYPKGRGAQCTSGDAAGFPIAALLLTADELALGVLDHALRFILPGGSMGTGFVLPATHGTTDSHSDDPDAPLYGYRFRLNGNFDTKGYNAAEKVVIKGLQTYGMFLSDEGTIPITISNDAFTTSKYKTFHFNTHSLYNLTPADFEVMPYPGEISTPGGSCALIKKLPKNCLNAKPVAAILTPSL